MKSIEQAGALHGHHEALRRRRGPGARSCTAWSSTAHLGEMSFLVGPSGCGKTTLISIIAGLLDANGGETEVLGRRPLA